MKIVKLLKLLLCGSDRKYNFTLLDRWMGANLCLSGYRTYYAEEVLEQDARLQKIRINDFEFYVPINIFKANELAYIYNEVFLPVSQNPHSYETDFIRIQQGDVVIDAGACEGFFTKYALDRRAKKVFAFEPLPVLQDGLTKTFSQFITSGHVQIVDKGLSDTTGSTKINLGKDYICEAQIDETGSETIVTVTLDEFVQSEKLPKVDFIKMDIEGAEVAAIYGAKEVIRRFSPKLSIAVYHDYDNALHIKDFLLGINPGYTVVFGGCYMYERPFRPFMLYAY